MILRRCVRQGWCLFAMFWPIVLFIAAVVIVTLVLIHAFRPHFSPPAPAITSIDPNNGSEAGGTEVTIHGSGFARGSTVMFGDLPATGVQFINSNELTAIAPPDSGVLDVRVTTDGRSSAPTPADKFTYVALAVTNVNPATGPVAGNIQVTINGTGFDPGSTVTFSDLFGDVENATNVQFVSANQIIATAPPGANFLSVVDVQVITAEGNISPISDGDQFTYLTPGQPTVQSINPATGPVAGNTPVIINGTGFVLGGSTVTFTDQFGDVGNATNVNVVNANEITANSPPGDTFFGLVDVQVTTAAGTSPITNADLFTYVTGAGGAAKASAKKAPAKAVLVPADSLATQLLPLINSFRTQKGLKPLSSNASLTSLAQQYTEDILAKPDRPTDVTLIAANSTPPITFTNEVDAVLTSSGNAQLLFDTGIKGNAITLAAINNPALTSFGGYFTNDPSTPGGFKGTIIFGQGVSP